MSGGIPHLWADSADELAFLQGMNAATDRSWQIELERWRSEGRAAEALGADVVVWDRFARQARLDDTARRCFENLDAATQRWCGQYVAGINQALSDGRRGGPEFEESGSIPEPWNPWTPLGVFLVHHILFSTFPPNKLFRAHVARTLGDDAVSLFSIEAPVWSGSNAWAAHGSTTASGLPLIAGDPPTASWNCPASTSKYGSPARSSMRSDSRSRVFPASPPFCPYGQHRLGHHQRHGRLPGSLHRGVAPGQRLHG